MPLDAICLSAVVRETAAQAENTRIEKIQQPARDQVVLLLRGGRRLLLCAGATQPRLHLTEQLRDNPSQPPMFCMLLRKHLAGGRILSVVQEPLERVVTLTIQAADELGEQRQWRLILEAMPRHANLILVDHQGRITDCLRRVDFEMSQQRQVLPGLFYHLPPRQEKRSPLEVSREEFLELLSALPEGAPLDGWLLDTFTALPPADGPGAGLCRIWVCGRRPVPGQGREIVGQLRSLAGQNHPGGFYAHPAATGRPAGGFHLLPHHPVRRCRGAGELRQLRQPVGRIL